jgi:hypothetical protein
VKLPHTWVIAPASSKGDSFFTGTYKVTASYVPSATQPITGFNVIRQTAGTFANTTEIPSTGSVTSYTASTSI